ncbi:LysR family transcriptional regulator [Halobacteriovorax marinus]|uniref:LysR family transcriptional regulator n=1 Tax=Halobacteriovorax marinus TaxID=97084 RepID=A0A1Y5F7K5_9BACT|nr:LysR family transcriptional regulator [Halobacteriovorax marinus]
MINLNDIPIFIEVVKTKSFSKAAISLGLTKSKVSKSISSIELELGIKLLHRTTRKISLTESGTIYFEQVIRGIGQLKNAEQAAGELQETAKGNLKILIPMSLGRLHLCSIISKFIKKYEDISIEMVLSDEKHDLLEKGFDLAIQAGEMKDSSFIGRKLCPLRSVICVSKTYLQKHPKPSNFKQLMNHNCLLYSHSTPMNEWIFTKGKAEERIIVNGTVKINNSEALKELVLQGVGVSRLPTFIAGEDLKKGKLLQLFKTYEMPSKNLYAIFPDREFLPLKVRVFLDFLVANVGGNKPYWDEF